MNVFFLIHFLVRLIAARDALVFWVDWFSIIDYLTVPPTLLGFWIRRTWLGFRFVRAFRLVNLSEVLHNLNLIKSASSLRLCHFCTMFMSIWLSGAGMLLLLENTGDIFHGKPYNVTNPITYTNALYFTIVTMSTVGYGDITPQTVLGRVYISLFILIALATFASAIPVIAENFFTVRKYSGSYMKPEGKSHIVVCGEITTDSVKTFLSDFLHEDRQRSDVEVVFINPCMPDLQLQSILRLHFSRVKYFQGTVMSHIDLQRVRMDEADACLILASSMATDVDQKDAANIMRVIAVKNYACHVRVIVQLLQTQNKQVIIMQTNLKQSSCWETRHIFVENGQALENFPEVFCLPGSPLSRADLRAARIRWCSICVVLGSAGHAHTEDPYLLDKEVILCSLNIRGMRFAPISPAKASGSCVPQRKFGYEIPMITELTNDANIHYLDLDDFETGSAQIPASLTAPFARGIAFTSSVLDVLASTAYFDRNAMTLMRHLITGGVTPALEQWLAEGGMLNTHERSDKDGDVESSVRNKELRRSRYHFQSQIGLTETRQRPRVAQLSVMDTKLRPNPPNVSRAFTLFGDLFCFAIRERGILCLGVYRNSYLTKDDNDSNIPLLLRPNEYTASRVKPQNRKCSNERRLSTCAQPIDHVIRKYSHQLNRETNAAIAAEVELSVQNAEQSTEYQSAHLFNSPYWNWDAGDEIICFSELKLGFLAQSCVAPGFSTLLTNLFSMQSQRGLKEATQKYQNKQLSKLTREQGDLHLETDKRRLTSTLVQSSPVIRNSLGNQILSPRTLHWTWKCPTFVHNMFRVREHRTSTKTKRPIIRITAGSLPSPESPFNSRPTSTTKNYSKMQIDDDWLVNYLRGLSMEIYSARLSPSFEGLSFAEAAVVCREKLDLLLIAVVARVPERQRRQAYEFSRLSALGFEVDGDYEEDDEDDIYGESDQEDSKQYLAINPPSNVNVYITGDTTAFFICDSQNNASRATIYCSECHGNHPHLLPALVKACGCRPKRS
ncbi:hypothetical protein AHF37_09451, partial [Paragonimus kellicotti]